VRLVQRWRAVKVAVVMEMAAVVAKVKVVG
jgi:hypothetical protein